MSKQDLDLFVERLKTERKVADIKVVSYNEETNEANLLIIPVKTLEHVELEEENDDPTCGGMLSECEQCDEISWDGRICHSCGAKDI